MESGLPKSFGSLPVRRLSPVTEIVLFPSFLTLLAILLSFEDFLRYLPCSFAFLEFEDAAVADFNKRSVRGTTC